MDNDGRRTLIDHDHIDDKTVNVRLKFNINELQ